MPNEDKMFIGGSLVLNLRIWWCHMKTLYRVLKCDITKKKIFEIMGFTEIFWKYMKNAYLPNITYRTKTKLQGFVWSQWGM